jgi:hypothetical protein
MADSNPLVHKRVDLTEYGEVKFPRQDWAFLTELEFQQVREAIRPLVEVSRLWEGDQIVFQAGSRVGVIQTHGLRVQVRPALASSQMLALIRYAFAGNVPLQFLRSFAAVNWETGFENLLCWLLCAEAQEIERIGISRNYQERREPLTFIRGRPLWPENFPWRGAKARELTCRYHRLTYDNADNRLLLAGLKSAWRLATKEAIKRRPFQHRKRFGDLAAEVSPEPAQFIQAAQRYTRLTEHYRAAHSLSAMLLYSLRPESLYEGGEHLVFGIVLDMADLFERFIAQLMQDILEPFGFRLVPQSPDRAALLDAAGHPYSSVRPDLLIYHSQVVRGVIDAKYKPYWPAAQNNSSPARKIANADLYQLFFYQQRLQRKFNLPAPPAAVIASPLPEEDEMQGNTVIADRFRRVVWQAGQETAGDVRLLLIPVTKFLRLLLQGERPGDIIVKIGLDRLRDLFVKFTGSAAVIGSGT